jgi:hypothetical protein
MEALFNQLPNLTDVQEIVRISAEHEVNFLLPRLMTDRSRERHSIPKLL